MSKDVKQIDVARRIHVAVIAVSAVLGLLFGVTPTVLACSVSLNQQSCSPGYAVDEVFFGSGGDLNDCSSHYCAKESAGDLAVGNTSSGNQYQAQAGFNTDRTPSLTFIVNAANISLGTLTPGSTATTSATFSVESYLAHGYQVQTVSPPPQDGSYTMQAPASPVASSTSAEQFGINLVANNSCGGGLPAVLGNAPLQVPNATFSFGVAAHNSASDYYDIACKFMYKNGDVIATSAESSGETDYTISYIFNTTNVTPGGIYTFNQVLVATSTY